MTQAVATEIQIRPYVPDDESSVLELLRKCLGESENLQRKPEVWRWKHLENAFGRSYALVASQPDGRVIGLRAFLRWEFLERDTPVRAVRAVDTAVDPEFRRGGLFTRLTLRALDDVRAEGTALVFNTPNERSLAGYLKMGWREVGTVAPLIKVRRYPRFMWGMTRQKVLGRRNGDPGARPHAYDTFFRDRPELPTSPALDVIDSASLGQLIDSDSRMWAGMIRTRRSPAYLRWRYGNHPTIRYRAVLLGPKERPDALAIFRPNTRYGLREIVISELLVRDPDRVLVSELVDAVAARVRADYLVAYFPEGTFHRRALESSGFRKVPVGGMTLATNPLDGPRSELSELSSWGLSIGDLEYF
jgi:GNAT superfamily N-acetyltransferase